MEVTWDDERFNMVWKCVFGFCVFSALSLKILFTHLNLVHSDDEFRVICGLGDSPGCQKVFHKYNSFYKHVRRKHDDLYKGHTAPPVHRNYFIVPTEQGIEDGSRHSDDFGVEETNITENLTSVHETSLDPNEDLDDQMRKHAILFLEQ